MSVEPVPFWLVWSPDGARPPRIKHESEAAARKEADRLAVSSPGSKFYVLSPVCSTVVCQHVREEFLDDGVPF